MRSHAVASRCSSPARSKSEARDRVSWAMKWTLLWLFGCAGVFSYAHADERLAQTGRNSGEVPVSHLARPAKRPPVGTAEASLAKMEDQIRKLPPLPAELIRPGEP